MHSSLNHVSAHPNPFALAVFAFVDESNMGHDVTRGQPSQARGSGGALAPTLPRATRNEPERGARRRSAAARLLDRTIVLSGLNRGVDDPQ